MQRDVCESSVGENLAQRVGVRLREGPGPQRASSVSSGSATSGSTISSARGAKGCRSATPDDQHEPPAGHERLADVPERRHRVGEEHRPEAREGHVEGLREPTWTSAIWKRALARFASRASRTASSMNRGATSTPALRRPSRRGVRSAAWSRRSRSRRPGPGRRERAAALAGPALRAPQVPSSRSRGSARTAHTAARPRSDRLIVRGLPLLGNGRAHGRPAPMRSQTLTRKRLLRARRQPESRAHHAHPPNPLDLRVHEVKYPGLILVGQSACKRGPAGTWFLHAAFSRPQGSTSSAPSSRLASAKAKRAPADLHARVGQAGSFQALG